MRLKILGRVAGATMLSCVMATQAFAALDGTCTIVVTRQGILTVNPNIDVLGSKLTGGRSAQASIAIQPGLLGATCSLLQILVCFSLTVVQPASFAQAPSGGSAGVSFTTTMRINGAALERPQGTPVTVLNGNHTVDIDLTATRSSGIFPAGQYQGVVTLRCE